ncbi:hypothetical protein F1C16_15960 [Hymenobacter sp. NBH84]|uniref:SIR2 family protein n=1 Tax=Hymenobacter sp. NBH84 TaxID=2596915 RepID=UPI0016232FA5|nr:SIR2 family protein [Hymenobacter sp. NBH84]QNE40953.1 hypothetical protein F1C16_15960 [Hymenobacter sp. NBH84]
MKKVTILTGNGLNYLIAGIIKGYPYSGGQLGSLKESTSSNIYLITKLWEEFDDVFKELSKELNNVNPEELIRMVYAVINLFSSIDTFEKVLGRDKITEIKKAFDIFLIDKIIQIAEKFRRHENIDQYKDVRKYFRNFSEAVNEYAQESETVVSVATTNYDGLLETLLVRDKEGYSTSDGFKKVSNGSDLLHFDPLKFDEKKIHIMHLHGSYKYTKHLNTTYKLIGVKQNERPVMIFNNKHVKESIIKSDNVLSYYFNKFEKDISESHQLIILGNSMKTEPHIKAVIKRLLHPNANVMICSDNPQAVHDEILEFLNNQNVIHMNTLDIHTERDFIDLFKTFMIEY